MTDKPPIEKAYLSTAEVAELVGLSKKQIMSRVESGNFPMFDTSVSVCSRKYWHRERLMRWLKQRGADNR